MRILVCMFVLCFVFKVVTLVFVMWNILKLVYFQREEEFHRPSPTVTWTTSSNERRRDAVGTKFPRLPGRAADRVIARLGLTYKSQQASIAAVSSRPRQLMDVHAVALQMLISFHKDSLSEIIKSWGLTLHHPFAGSLIRRGTKCKYCPRREHRNVHSIVH